MNYVKLIDPYLYGSLSPEEQLVFERQLARNPVLANEFSIRFSLARVLLAGPKFPIMSNLRVVGECFVPAAPKSTRIGWLWFACAAAVMAGVFVGAALG